MVTTPVSTYTDEQVKEAVEAVVKELQRFEWERYHVEAYDAFCVGEYQFIDGLILSHMDDSMLRSLGYLASAITTPQKKAVAKILSEAARAAADFSRERTIAQLNAKMAEIFKSPDF